MNLRCYCNVLAEGLLNSERFLDCLRGRWAPIEIALRFVAAHILKEVGLLFRLNTLGHYIHLQRMRKRNDALCEFACQF